MNPKSPTPRRPIRSSGPGSASASPSFVSVGSCSFTSSPDGRPMDSTLVKFLPLTPSQRKTGKYFLVVAAVLLLQIAAGIIMAHAYYDRRSFYGIELQNYLPFNFLRDVHIQTAIVWIGFAWIGAGLFLAPAMAGGREARGQALLVDLLFWATVVTVTGALIGNW